MAHGKFTNNMFFLGQNLVLKKVDDAPHSNVQKLHHVLSKQIF